MQTGEYITHRLMVDIIKGICTKKGITCTTLSDDWLVELRKGGVFRRIIGYKFSINDSVASSIAGDKVATHLLLKQAGLPSVEHVLLRPKVSAEQKEPLEQWDGIVVKPLDGSGGHGVKLCADADAAVAWIESTDHPAWAASPLVDATREIRMVLLDQQPLIVYEKQGVMIDGLMMFNLGMGAAPKDVVADEALLLLAAKAQQALGLRLSAVDVIETAVGERMILEINSGFMMENYIRHSPENRQRATEAYEKIIDAVMRG